MSRPMKGTSVPISEIHDRSESEFSRNLIGEIVSVDSEGIARVSFPGNHGVPIEARSVLDAPARAGEHPDALVGAMHSGF